MNGSSKQLTPFELDALAQTEGTTLAQMRAHLPVGVQALSPLRAWSAFARAWATVSIGEVALGLLHFESGPGVLWRVPLFVGLWLFVASGLVGLFILGHDCGHGAFSRSRTINAVVGHICMSPLLTGFYSWRLSHNHHHARTSIRGEDTDWPERMLSSEEYARAPLSARLEARLGYSTPVGLAVGFIVGMVRRTFMSKLYPQVKQSLRTRRQLLLSNIVMIAVTLGIVVSLYLNLGLVGVFKHYIIPIYLGMILGALFTYLHHTSEGALVFEREGWTPIRGQVVATFDVRFPSWLERHFFYINRHLPHHIAPKIPWYHLPAATDALALAFPAYHQERVFSLGYLRRAWRAPLLKKVGEGVFVSSGALSGPVKSDDV